jgi:hypothetical protein
MISLRSKRALCRPAAFMWLRAVSSFVGIASVQFSDLRPNSPDTGPFDATRKPRRRSGYRWNFKVNMGVSPPIGDDVVSRRRVWLFGLATAGALLIQSEEARAQFTQPRIGPYRAPEPNAVVRPVAPALRDWYEQRGAPPRVAAPQRPGSSRVYRSPASRRIDGPRPFPYD